MVLARPGIVVAETSDPGPAPLVSAVPNGAGGSPLWAQKTPAEILADVNNALVGAWSASAQVELHDTVLLPVTQYGTIASTARSPNTDTTILTYLQANNIYTSSTGQPLTIRTLRQLAGAGAGGTNRMITYRRDPQVLKFHMPMPHQFFPGLCRKRNIYHHG